MCDWELFGFYIWLSVFKYVSMCLELTIANLIQITLGMDCNEHGSHFVFASSLRWLYYSN